MCCSSSHILSIFLRTLKKLKEKSEEYGLFITFDKRESMIISGTYDRDNPIIIDNQTVKVVNEFCYLGSIIRNQ